MNKNTHALATFAGLAVGCAEEQPKPDCAEVVFEIQGTVERVDAASESNPLFSEEALGPLVGTLPLGICTAARTDDGSNPESGDYDPRGLSPIELQVGGFQLTGSGAPVHLVIGNSRIAELYTFDGQPDGGGPIQVDGVEQPDLHLYFRLYDPSGVAFDSGDPPADEAYAGLTQAELGLWEQPQGGQLRITLEEHRLLE